MDTIKFSDNAQSSAGDPSLQVQKVPEVCEEAHKLLFTPDALTFVGNLINNFSSHIAELHEARKRRQNKFLLSDKLPEFRDVSSVTRPTEWNIAPLPPRLLDRMIDVGDISPANLVHLEAALSSNAQGVQVDFDDGHCPLWPQQIKGLYNVVLAATGQLPGLKSLQEMPIMMLRPRAWNMIEHNATMNGTNVPGALFDFGLLIYHLGRVLLDAKSGPYFYLSKLEDANEARLWNQIFIWTQKKLHIPHGSIKACVLIENILAAFQMEEILYELKDHSLGLNYGMWDYTASIINKFGHRREFMFYDRQYYVNVKEKFVSSVISLMVSTCHKHCAPATGGMVALLVPESQNSECIINKVIESKKYDIEMGLDGFLLYDLQLIPHIQNVWKSKNLYSVSSPVVTSSDLLAIPSGRITVSGIKHNIAISVLFIYHWLQGEGHFYFEGAVEDSATTEISRLQLYQWMKHKALIEETNQEVNMKLIQNFTNQFTQTLIKEKCRSVFQCNIASSIFLDLMSFTTAPEFITSYLNDSEVFRTLAIHFYTKRNLAKL